ncbi:Uncharacterized protein APZ42_011090 [Daphnia magna]|uniref:Uncharacterized protein n=1 Tax=Daphnia magna TaxID=35525 RepID=A0A162T6Q0_9CRUS|nr:Uncharacterized protein APZ42_011090 [Daphnia magna]
MTLCAAVTSSSVHTQFRRPIFFLRMWRIVFCLRGRKRRGEHPPLNQVVMGMVAGGVRGSLCRKRLCLHIHDDTDAEKKRVGT